MFILKLANYFYNIIKKSSDELVFGSSNYWEVSDIEQIKFDFNNFINGMLEISYQDLFKFFDKLSIKYEFCGKALNPPFAISFAFNNDKYVILLNGLSKESAPLSQETISHPETALSFIEDADLDQYVGESSVSDDFWDSPSYLFHATDSDNYDYIFEDGLRGSSNSRGLTNRSVGNAVFVSTNPDVIDAYGDLILKIDTKAMKNDNYTPEIGIEPDVEEGERKQSLAYMLGLDDYSYDFETGIDYDTYIIYGDVPAKYLTVYEE